MAIIDRQIMDTIVSRGLGDSEPAPTFVESAGYNEQSLKTLIIVREEKEHFPATGIYSTEEDS